MSMSVLADFTAAVLMPCATIPRDHTIVHVNLGIPEMDGLAMVKLICPRLFSLSLKKGIEQKNHFVIRCMINLLKQKQVFDFPCENTGCESCRYKRVY